MTTPPAHDIFLSYGHSDVAVAKRYADALEREGFSVWWDAALRSGEAFDAAIETALESARAVVVLWSASSAQSRWVRAEATLAERNGTLIPVMIESCRRPIMFELTHTPDLSHWTGSPVDAAWQSFAAEVRQLVAKGAPRSQAVTPAAHAPATERKPSIAVLPFANMSGDKEQEYFSDGLAEEIINALSQIPGLKVIARTSAFAFRGQNTDIRRIADTLGVTHVLEGSVRRAGNRIRVTAQLIIATDGTHLWSERYDRELADVFAVQDEISVAISEALKVRLSHAAVLRHTPTLPAHEALLKARHFHWKATHQSMDQAKVYYEQAIALDPKFALAHVLYADFLFGRTSMGAPLREAVSESRALAQRALELEPSLVDAHAPLCVWASTHDYDWKEAGRQYALAMADGQASPHTHMSCGCFYLLGSGRRDEAVKHLEIAVRGDPLHLMHRTVLGICLGAVGRHAEADELFLQSMDLDSGYFWTLSYLAFNYAARQMFAEALPLAEKSFSLAPRYQPTVGVLAGLLVRMGQPDRAQEVLATLGPDETYGVPLSRALFHTCCDEIDLAADWYGKAIEERDARVLLFLQSAIGESIRRSPRWPGLAAMANLPEVGLPAT
ncbi:MAG: TIR domain-containing protein [Steroidobacteraceae bacterium]